MAQSTWKRLDASMLTAAVGVMYAIGFIVANAHMARYQLLRMDLLRGRYIGAALLAVILTSIPIAFAGLGFFEVDDQLKKTGHDGATKVIRFKDEIPHMRAAVLPLLVGIATWVVAVRVIAAEQTPRMWALFGVYFVLAYVYGWELLRLRRYAVSRPTPASSAQVATMAYSLVVIAGIFLVVVFGRRIYPRIAPAYGGAGTWLATVSLAVSDTSARKAMDAPVVLFDQTERFMTLLLCEEAHGRGTLRAVAVPLDSIGAVSLQHMVSVLDLGRRARRDGCGSAMAERNDSTKWEIWRTNFLRRFP